ncbi:HNH endonuclease [Scandinavium sp. NPDC088450]|uniref:HNH endonuclease n=1 Tax=Scandinavium sp. NPDC088450 TaxID=3364514 RepID=UPI00384E8B57
MTQRYSPELAEQMKKRRYWFCIDGQRLTSARAVNDYLGENLCHAAWRADLIADSGGESMKIGDRTRTVPLGKHAIYLERREDVSDKSMKDYSAACNKLRQAGWSEAELEELGDGQLYQEYRAEISRQKLAIPLFDHREIRYTRAEIRPAQGRFRKLVMSNWENRCAITGTRMALEAAHIIGHAKKGAATIENGLCLAADLHTLMDSGHLLIERNQVRFSDQAKADPRYAAIEGVSLRTPLHPVCLP